MNERIIVEIEAEGADSGTVHDVLSAILHCDVDRIIKVQLGYVNVDGVHLIEDISHVIPERES